MANKYVVCVTGGIAAYKSADIVNALASSHGNEVQVIMTKHAAEFITPLTLQTLSKRKVLMNMFDEDDHPEIINHIYYAQNYDMIIVLPATANCIGKAANGLADDLVTSTIIAANIPVLFVPAMNTEMYHNKIVQKNIQILKECGYYVMEPESGQLACNTYGKGKLPNKKAILEKITEIEKNSVIKK